MSERKEKPIYNLWQNTGWMIRNAWNIRKSVLFLCIAVAVGGLATSLTELFVAPVILKKVETSAPFSELLWTIVGFALLDAQPFGSSAQYLDLAEFYVSAPFRRQGLGRALFAAACREARRRGARFLYISAHSAEDSMAAYARLGCTAAEEVNAALAEREPFDIPLQFAL